MRAKEKQEISHRIYKRQLLENRKNILRSHKKRVMEMWASNPRALNGWGLCNKKSFMTDWLLKQNGSNRPTSSHAMCGLLAPVNN